MRQRAILLGFGAVLVASAGFLACSNDQPATGGNQPGQPGTGGGGDSGTVDSGGPKGDAGPGSDSGTPVVDAGPALCDPAVPWVSAGRLPTFAPTSFSQFGAVSGGETSIAYTASNGDVYVADRATTADDFTTASKVNLGATTVAADRVALSPTGKSFIAVSSDRSQLVEFDRATVGGTWTLADRTVFQNIDAMLSETSGAVLAEPVIGADKNTLLFLATLGANKPTIYESRYSTTVEQWAAPTALLPAQLRATDASHRRRPTGLSSDRRTLFYFDEVAGHEMAAWRDTQDSAFTTFVDLTGFDEGAPNTACDTLYFQGTDGSGAGVFVTE